MSQPARIDLIGLCTDAGAACRGAAMGPEALRIAGLVETLLELGHRVDDQGDVRAPMGAKTSAPSHWRLPSRRQAEVLAIAAEGSARGYESLKAGGLPVFLGGDHSISMGSISGVARHCDDIGKELFVLWVDAHGDFNTPATSPSGNLHGMSLALLCGEPEFGDAFGGSWRGEVDPRNVTIFGARSIDREERALLTARGVDVMDMRLIDEVGATALIRRVIDRVKAANGHLHLSFDIDSVDPSIAPGTGTRVEGGLTYREAHLVMEMLHDSGLVGSADIVEVNPYLDHAGQTAELAVGLMACLFGRQIVARAPARPGMTPAERARAAL
jgi:arginase